MKKIFLKIKKKISPDYQEVITKSERYTIITALKLMKLPDTELTMHPSKDKYYIRSGDDQLWIKIDNYPANITIVNHKFQYDIKLSNRAMNIIRNKFIEITERRRDKIERKFLDNTENSLRSICNRIG